MWIRQHKIAALAWLVAGYVMFEIATIPFGKMALLKTENPPQTALMLQRPEEAKWEGKPLKIKQTWIPLSKVPRHVRDAVIVAEHGAFFSHDGVD